ncbi:MAG: SIMPL domain-containing protein [Deltaproteobacteria bacterium]|nr:SIMPL domain-containing protein [Deltaproteobacteria bacterium]
MKKWLAAGLFALVVCALSPEGVIAKDNVAGGEARRTISVSGVAEAVLDAEYAKVSITVSNAKPKMSESHDATVNDVKSLYSDIKKVGVKESDIDKSLMVQEREYEYDEKKKRRYRSSVYMVITVRDVNKLDGVYAALAGYDSVTAPRTQFERNDEFEQRKELFKKALLAAKTKAELMAKTLGSEVGEVVSIEENAWAENYFVGSQHTNGTIQVGENDIRSYGSVTIKARVIVVFELK